MDSKERGQVSKKVGVGMGKVTIVREEHTEYLFPGLLSKEMEKHQLPGTQEALIYMEPKIPREDELLPVYFSQDYPMNRRAEYLFYTLPSYGKDHKLAMGDNCALVTYAADPEFHKPKDVKKIYDIGFIGNPYYEERNQYLNVIQGAYPNSFFNQSGIPGQDVPGLLNQCKILFNHTRKIIDVNLRFFESMALGCQVMERNQYLDQFATDGVHYMGYSSHEELLEVLKKLLADDDLRLKIAHNARKHFLKHHTYTHRCKTIIKKLTEFYSL